MEALILRGVCLTDQDPVAWDGHGRESATGEGLGQTPESGRSEAHGSKHQRCG